MSGFRRCANVHCPDPALGATALCISHTYNAARPEAEAARVKAQLATAKGTPGHSWCSTCGANKPAHVHGDEAECRCGHLLERHDAQPGQGCLADCGCDPDCSAYCPCAEFEAREAAS